MSDPGNRLPRLPRLPRHKRLRHKRPKGSPGSRTFAGGEWPVSFHMGPALLSFTKYQGPSIDVEKDTLLIRTRKGVCFQLWPKYQCIHSVSLMLQVVWRKKRFMLQLNSPSEARKFLKLLNVYIIFYWGNRRRGSDWPWTKKQNKLSPKFTKSDIFNT